MDVSANNGRSDFKWINGESQVKVKIKWTKEKAVTGTSSS